jgi:shikimate dehydrogenase
LQGFSTDGLGLERAVREQLDVELREMRVLILGAGGGAGHAVARHCAAAGVLRLALLNRTLDKLHAMQEALAGIYPREFLSVYAWNDAAMAKALAVSDLVINCSSLGMKPDDPSPIPAALLSPRHLIFDTIYVWKQTPLMRAAAQVGARSANGLDMLLHQGAIAFEIWFQREAPVEIMRAALRERAASQG